MIIAVQSGLVGEGGGTIHTSFFASAYNQFVCDGCFKPYATTNDQSRQSAFVLLFRGPIIMQSSAITVSRHKLSVTTNGS